MWWCGGVVVCGVVVWWCAVSVVVCGVVVRGVVGLVGWEVWVYVVLKCVV